MEEAKNMKRLLFIIVILTLTGMLFTSCREDPVDPAKQELRDGEWTGYGEGRNGAIVAKVLIAGHQVERVTIVNQSESVFAQDAINTIVAKAVGRQDAMNVEVDGVSSCRWKTISKQPDGACNLYRIMRTIKITQL